MDQPPALPTKKLRWSGHSDVGRKRTNNEDSFLGLQFDAQEAFYLGKIGEASTGPSDFIFAVSDGMGGAQAGEFASRIAVDKIMRLMPPTFKRSAEGISTGFEDIFDELYSQIHRALCFLGGTDDECTGMGATLSLCWFTPEWMYYAHVGDSRIYYLPADGPLKQLSQDDTYVGWLYRQGKLTEYEMRNHPGRSSLQKALGAGNRYVEPQVGAVGYEPGDSFILCTDGLVDGLYNDNIVHLLRQPNAQEQGFTPARRLVDRAVADSGRDNTTALVIETFQ